jgi:release factor glutamine methyltransferase
MSISIADSVLQGAQNLRRAGVPEAQREAGSLLAHVLKRDRSFILSHADDLISAEQLASFRDCIEWRARGKPFQYITRRQEFFGLDFEVTEDVLIPRPETELLVETALKLLPETDATPFICDVGTGSGCIVISLLHEHPNARAIATDISEAAISVAKRNAAQHSVEDRIDFVISDCLAEIGEAAFDLIVSNPPYVAERAFDSLQREVRDFEPQTALMAGEDGLLIIRRLLLEAPGFLKTGAHLLLEIGFDQRERVEHLIDPSVWELLDIHQDLKGIPRTLTLQKLAPVEK